MALATRVATGSQASSNTVTAAFATAPGTDRVVIAAWRFRGTAESSGPVVPAGWTAIGTGLTSSGSVNTLGLFARKGDGSWTDFVGNLAAARSQHELVLVELRCDPAVATPWDRYILGGNGNNVTTHSVGPTPGTQFASEIALAFSSTADGNDSTATGGTWTQEATTSRCRVFSQQLGAVGSTASATFTWTSACSIRDGIVTVRALPPASQQPPLCDVGADRNALVSSTVTITAADSDTDGTITGRAWTQVSGPAVTLSGASTTTVQFTAPAVTGPVVLRYTVTDDDGLTASDDVTVTVVAAGQTVYPASDLAATNVVREPVGAASNASVTADANDATYVAMPTGSSFSMRFTPLTPVTITTGWSLRLRLAVDAGTASYTVRVRVLQSATTVATRTISTGVTTTMAEIALALTQAEIAAIPDRGAPLDVYFDQVTLT